MTSPVDTLKEMRDTLAGHAESMTGAALAGARNDLAALDAAIAALSGGEAEPAGHHYVYLDPFGSGREVIVHNNGGEWNGQSPLRAIPYYYTTPRIPDGIDGQVIALLVAGGFVSQAKVDEARNIAISAAPGDEGRGDG